MSAHQPSTARRPFAARRLAARVGAGLLALAGCLLLAGLLFMPAVTARADEQAADVAMERVEAANAFPLSAVVRVVTTFPDDRHGGGSGCVIDRFHVLTAGHSIYSDAHGGFPQEVRVYAGQTGSTYPFKVAKGVNYRTFASFIDDNKASKHGEHRPGDGDIGLITLDRPLGDETGAFRFGYNDDDFFNGKAFFKAGYPGEKGYDFKEMYISHGPVLGAHPGKNPSFGYVAWDASSMAHFKGQSGSGLYLLDEETGEATIYAVQDLGKDERGYAERITKDVFDAIQGWIAEDGQPDAPNGPDAPDGPNGPDEGDNP